MEQTLPLPVVRYLAAVRPGQIAECFTEDAVVVDERKTRRGRAEIRQWREEAAKIDYRQDILSVGHDGERALVRCRLTGDFPGSPVELDYRLELAGDHVARLEIA
ncbi:nuclear transport factor 2 family protein [Oceaniglobus roseus]|uniref:nuclear transport factor 2 family protein n=1 Tax=Oceaniglobus roseus TaxID=1737570 RepID=UPI000C7F69FC|nr:nuclear transport factor 2 family protein [Kandeliimicrobium roseum]